MKLGNVADSGWPRLLTWATGCLTLLAIAAGGCRGDGENLASGQVLQGADKGLLQAAQAGDLGLLQAAIADGAAVNCRSTNGMTPLLQVLSGTTGPLDADRRRCLATLLEHGAGVNEKDGDGRTPLISASRRGDLETVRWLVEAGTYVKAPDRFHKTALLYAVEGRHRDIVAYLAVNGDLQSQPYAPKKTKSP